VSRRFTTLVLLSQPALPEPEPLEQVLTARFDRCGPAEVPRDMVEDDLMVVDLGGELMALERIDAPMPHAPLDAPVQPERPFDASEAVSAHAACLRVVGLEEPADSAAALRQARAVTVTAGVLARMLKGLAAFYPTSGALLPEGEALRAAHTVQAGVSPIEAWVTFYPLGPEEDGETVPHGACTLGLEPLIGREIEVAPLPMTRRKALDRAYGATWRALDGEDPLEDGLELRDADDKVYATVRAARHWLREGVPAWVLVGPDAVVEPRKLRLKRGTDPAVLKTPVTQRPPEDKGAAPAAPEDIAPEAAAADPAARS
jgi:hypothetical protein